MADEDGRPSLVSKENLALGRSSWSAVFVDDSTWGRTRQSWSTKIADQVGGRHLALGRSSWSAVFVDDSIPGRTRQGWPTKMVDQEESSIGNLVARLGRQTLSTTATRAGLDQDGRPRLPTKITDQETKRELLGRHLDPNAP